MILPRAIYDNRVEPQVGDFLYIVPESDSVIAERMEISEVSHLRFDAGSYSFAWTGNAVHVGRNVAANAYDSEAAYHAIQCFESSGWAQYKGRRDVYFRRYVNNKISPPLRTEAFVQIDHFQGELVLNGWYPSEGINVLQEISDSFHVKADDTDVAFKIRSFLEEADAIILASYAMNIRPLAEKPKARFFGETIASARKVFFEGVVER